ncbi:hypothetical protein NA57DRAFT_73513 [Rhizodiscina lignyota]|uniref:ATPase of the ABC class C-terminal domain-containing protein n=1 Tax=Rhizodiscina lignyota TaxID=1504668 RepID=A0A9P4IPX1_9PEZI|nr:hypothetical protein NA57DRAFT_73513 [Rhizodiscina lignyota]
MTGANVVSFISPLELEVELDRPNFGPIKGMGIPKGITVLTDDGFHGNLTLLEAIQLGVYNVVPGDGQEDVVTDPTVVKIRSEDGRCVTNELLVHQPENNWTCSACEMNDVKSF